jgi:probable HAF family extracellular repeat protein
MRTPHQHRRSRSSRRPQLEQLEDRSVPSAYALIDLGNLGGAQSAQAYDINEAGQVVGYATSAAGPQRAFLWSDGVMTDLGTLGGSSSKANALNDVGQVVGKSTVTTGSFATEAFLWQGGVMAGLGLSAAEPAAINEAGQVAGYFSTNSGYRAFLWQGGVVTEIGDFGGGSSVATDINNAGQVVGSALTTVVGSLGPVYHAFLWQNGVMTDLGVLPGLEESGAAAINSLGQIVGSSDRTDPETYTVTSYSFLYSDGVMTTLPVPSSESYAGDINDSGQVVGTMRAGNGVGPWRAYLYSDGVVTDLNSLIPAGSGLHLYSATAINNAGQIVGYAYDAAAHYHAFLLTPTSTDSSQASSFVVSGVPSSIVAGTASSFTVTAKLADGSTATNYTGTVYFTSSDPQAVLPAAYTFTAADQGVHTFTVTLKTAGARSITVTDVHTGITGTQAGIAVNPAAASRLLISAPASVSAGARFSLTVTVVDAYGNVVTGYRGTIAFRSSDSTAKLPNKYTFTASDQGRHIFPGLVLKKKGKQTITVNDALSSPLTETVSIDVL